MAVPPFLLGSGPSATDLAAYHPIWFVRKNGGAEAEALLPGIPDMELPIKDQPR